MRSLTFYLTLMGILQGVDAFVREHTEQTDHMNLVEHRYQQELMVFVDSVLQEAAGTNPWIVYGAGSLAWLIIIVPATLYGISKMSRQEKSEDGRDVSPAVEKFGGLLGANPSIAFAAGTFLFLALLAPAAFAIQHMEDISAESAIMKQVRLYLAAFATNNGLAHVPIVAWLIGLGKGDCSWFGPFSDPGKKVENWLAIVLVFAFGIYGYIIFSMDVVSTANWPRFVFPIAMFLIGIAVVWIRFWKSDIFEWPADFATLWVVLAYNECLGGVFGLVYIIQLFTYKGA